MKVLRIKWLVKKFRSLKWQFSLPLLAFVLCLLSLFTAYSLYFTNLIYPKISIAKINVSFKNKGQAEKLLIESIKPPVSLTLVGKTKKSEILLKHLDFAYDFSDSVDKAYLTYRSGNLLNDFAGRIGALVVNKDLGLSFRMDENKLKETLLVIANSENIKAESPTVTLVNQQVNVNRGKQGQEIDQLALRATIGQHLSANDLSEINLPYKQTGSVLNDLEVTKLKTRAEKLIGKSLTFKYDAFVFTYQDSDLLKTLDFTTEYNHDELTVIVLDIANKINRSPQNSVFVFEGGKVGEFQPSKEGLTVDQDSLINKLTGNLRNLEISNTKTIEIEIPVKVTPPEVMMEEVNNLGIKELIGKGTSYFAHSIPNRIHNISLASSKFKGVLVAPGEVFSFNKILGDVSEFTGYKQAYIIKDGKTILGDGGGVCQVSSTLFRAVLNAGLPVLERQAHAYRVSYYEQKSPPGLDATVYDPTTDFKFKNDTTKHILIQPIFDAKNQSLVFELYGTKDGRVATISKPIISDTAPPPDDLYQDDPTLPVGQIKQIDYKAWGAKVTFNYKIEKDGQVVYKKTFISNYRPWQAVFLRGTKVN